MRNTKNKRRITRNGSGRSARNNGFRLSPQAWHATWRVIGWSLASLAVMYGMHRLQLRERTTRPATAQSLEWVDLPPWLAAPGGADALHDIATAADLRTEDDLADPGLCGRIAAGLTASSWVARVDRVSKRRDGTVRVRAEYREPFAFVESGRIVYRVDRDGVRLPLPETYYVDYIQDAFWNDWLRIVGVRAPVPEEGQAWEGEDLAAGLRLVRYLKEAGARGEVPFRSSLRAIDVANFGLRERGGDGELRIRTIDPHCYINWGLPPGEEYEIEADAKRKLDMLRALYARRGRLPEAILDVRKAEGIELRPPAKRATKTPHGL